MKKSHIIALVVIAISIGIIISMVNDASTYTNFDVAKAYPNREYHVIGTLDKEHEVVYNPEEDPNFFNFHMKDNEGLTKKVVVNSSPPRDFDKSENIVVVGKMKEDTFFASSLLMKCPSKYVEEELVVKSTE